MLHKICVHPVCRIIVYIITFEASCMRIFNQRVYTDIAAAARTAIQSIINIAVELIGIFNKNISD